jgi:hypothetical protein
VGRKGLADQGRQGTSRLIDPYPLRIGGRTLPVNPPRTVLAFGEKHRLGTSGIETGEKAICRHEGNASVGNENNDDCEEGRWAPFLRPHKTPVYRNACR